MAAHLFILGFPKCGTSSLYCWLSGHPDICASDPKETFFFMDQRCIFQPPWPTLRSGGLFDRFFQHGRERFLLEASPFHFDQRECLDFLSAQIDSRVVFMLRRPELRLYSNYVFFTKVIQGMCIADFSEYVDIVMGGNADQAALSDKRFEYILSNAFEWGRYVHYINIWQRVLGRERIFLGTLEEAAQDPRGFMGRLCAWLGIDDEYYDRYSFKSINKSYDVRYPALQRQLRRISGFNPMSKRELDTHISPFYFIGNGYIRGTVSAIYRRLQIVPSRVSDADQALIDQIGRLYRKDNLALFNQYGISF